MKLYHAVSNWFVSSVVAVAAVVAPASAAAAMTDLGTLGGASAMARDINEAGQIVGDAATSNSGLRAFLYSPWVGQMVDLGTLGGGFSEALAISDSGLVVGRSIPAGGGNDQAFIWEQGVMTALPHLSGTNISIARDVNNSGVVVGASGSFAVRWVNGIPQNLGALPGHTFSEAVGINASGVIVGNSFNASGQGGAWVFQNGVLTPLGTFGGQAAGVIGINSSGDIAGSWTPSTGGPPHGFLRKSGVFFDLGALGAGAFPAAIGNSGLVVGTAGDFNFNHAVLWDYNRNVVDLGGSVVSGALSVNSAGTAVGFAVVNSQFRAVVWK